MGSDSYAGKIVMTDKSGGASARSPMEIALADDIAGLDVSISRNGNGAMSQELEPHADSSQPMAYQIRITGQLDARWADWFEGLTITLDGGDTLITGPVVDQAALHGLLKRVRDLGMPLASVSPVESGPPTTRGTGLAGVSDVTSNVGVGGLSTSTSTTTGR
jgi:hypothetical protein